MNSFLVFTTSHIIFFSTVLIAVLLEYEFCPYQRISFVKLLAAAKVDNTFRHDRALRLFFLPSLS